MILKQIGSRRLTISIQFRSLSFGTGKFFLTLKGSDQAIGMAGPWFPEGCPGQEVGWPLFSDAASGKGLATEAARAELAHAFGRLGRKTAVSSVDPANIRSIRLAERLGARLDPSATPPDPTPVYRQSAPGGRA